MDQENAPEATAAAPVRHHALDGLRAAMMLLGIVIHAVLPYLPDPEAKSPFHDAAGENLAYLLVIFFIHSFRMPVFFVMAGFFAAMLRRRRGTTGLLRDRFARIVVPFVVGWAVLFPMLSGTGVFFRSGLRQVGRDLVSGKLYADPDLTHLWFLYYLTFFYVLGAGADRLAGWLPESRRDAVRRGFRRVLGSPWRPAWLAIPTALTLWPMKAGTFDTPDSFVPSPWLLAAYGVFFGFGWLLHGQADLLGTFARHARRQLALAVALWPLHIAAGLAYLSKPERPSLAFLAHLATVATGGLVAWLFLFGITGLFVRRLDRPSPTLRYLTDASYWCYIAHLPLIFWLAALLSVVPAPSPIKVLAIIVLSTALLLVAYHFLVRDTPLGAWLNGRRRPRVLPWDEPGAG